MADNEIIAEIRLELDKFRADLKEAEKAGKSSGETAAKGLGDGIESGFSKGIAIAKTAAVAAAAAFAGGFALSKVVEAGIDASETIRKLEFALKAVGQYTPELSASMQQHAEALKSVSGYDDDLILKGQTLLLTMTKLRGEGLDKATQSAVDLAAGMGIDLGSAFQIVERASAGHIRQLRQMGFDLKETGDKALDYAQAMNAISVFQGAAEAKAQTFGGALHRISLASEEMVKTVGKAITESPVMTGIVNLIAQAKEKTAAALKGFFDNGDKIGDFVLRILDIGVALTEYVLPPLETLWNVGSIIFNGLVTAANILIGGILRIGSTIAAIAAPFSDAAKGIQQTINDMIAANDSAIQDSMGKTEETIRNRLQYGGTDAAKKFAESVRDNVRQAADDAANAVNTIPEKTAAALQNISFKNIKDQMFEFENLVKVTSTSIAQQLNHNIVNGFANAGAAIGGALAKGENAFEAFGKSILKALGGILLQFGSMLIAVGIGLSTVPLLFGLSGPAAIAAGIAATVLGGAMMALGGGGGGGATAPSTGGGVAAAGGAGIAPSSDMGQSAVVAETKPMTQVHLNVYGNVLDRKETGMELLSILNENFSNSGGILATGNA